MKKLLFVLAAAVLTAVMPLPAFAEEAPVEDIPTESAAPRVEDMYKYTINSAGRAEITDFTVKDTYTGELIIPRQLDGYEVGYIDNAAFMNAKGITSVTIPNTVSDIGNSVFFGCESLERIKVEEGNGYLAVIDDGVLVADDQKFLVAYPAAKAGDSYTIPDTIDEIAPGCFGFAKNLKSITIPQKVAYVDNWAFAYSALESVNLSCTQIDEYAFAYCSNLHEVILNSGVETIEGAAFSVCPLLTHVTLPNTLTSVGQYAFAGTGMTDITIPPTVAELKYGCFGYDSNLKPVSGFTIYGIANSPAEAYATDSDPENDYENHFPFIAVESTAETTEPEETEAPKETNPDEEPVTEPETLPTEEPSDVGMREIIGAELTNNNFLQIVLATVGGIAVVLALTLIVLVSKKPKKKQQNKAAQPQQNEEEDQQQDEDEEPQQDENEEQQQDKDEDQQQNENEEQQQDNDEDQKQDENEEHQNEDKP